MKSKLKFDSYVKEVPNLTRTSFAKARSLYDINDMIAHLESIDEYSFEDELDGFLFTDGTSLYNWVLDSYICGEDMKFTEFPDDEDMEFTGYIKYSV